MGNFEYEVMATVLKLGSEPYGAEVWEELEERSRRDIAGGALYTALNRLERKGFLSSRDGEPTPERGGRAKKHYRIEAPGVAAMREHERRARLTFGNMLPEPV